MADPPQSERPPTRTIGAPTLRPPDILIVGGSGVVGRRIAARLAPSFPGRVVIAARGERKAESVCREIGRSTRARCIDVEDAKSVALALEGVGTVVNCVAQHELHLLRGAIMRGLAYTDIAPRLAFWQVAQSMVTQARATGACIVLGAGLSPGISNMMARQLAQAIGPVTRIETAILLSLADEYGPDSLRHVLEVVTQPFNVFEDGRRHDAVPFSDAQEVDFPEPLGTRTAYRFPWSDVVYYPQTLGAQTALARFALAPAWVGRLAASFVHAGAQRWLERPGFFRGNHRAIECLKQIYAGHDRFALVVTVEGRGGVMKMSLAGRHQADITATSAAEFARTLAAGEVDRTGVFLPEEVIVHERFFQALAASGWTPTVDAG